MKYGLSAGAWVEYKKALGDGNKKKEKEAAIASLGLSRDEAAILWQLAMDKDTKGSKNPYNISLGWTIYDERHGEVPGLYLPG